MKSPTTVAIVGAGPAGLTAANILERAGWRVRVFESDVSAVSRDQGGTLDLHPDSGQLALRKAGLLNVFLSTARHEDQEERVVDFATGKVLREVIPAPGSGDRPEIDRMVLRQLLLHPLGSDTVTWNANVERVAALADGRHEIRLSDGTAGPFDLVIGADGAWSRVRAALTDVRPAYSGVTFVELWLADVDQRHPELAALVGHGTLFALHDNTGVFAQRNGGAAIRVYAAFRTSAEEGDRPDKTLAGIRRSALLERFDAWAPSLTALIAESDRIAAVRPIVALPAGTKWRPTRGLTLIGDAAHVMPPLGVGVNQAMLDAAELAEALVNGADWASAVKAYEAAMFARTAQLSLECQQEFARWFSADGARAVMENMQSHDPA